MVTVFWQLLLPKEVQPLGTPELPGGADYKTGVTVPKSLTLPQGVQVYPKAQYSPGGPVLMAMTQSTGENVRV